MDADTRWDEGTRASEARRGARCVRVDDIMSLLGCNAVDEQAMTNRADSHNPVANEHRDAWCSRCGERLILTGYAGALGYIP